MINTAFPHVPLIGALRITLIIGVMVASSVALADPGFTADAEHETLSASGTTLRLFVLLVAVVAGAGLVFLFMRWATSCSQGGRCDEKLMESSELPPFYKKWRCRKCGRTWRSATPGL